MLTTSRHELEVFKERVLEVCRDMNLSLTVDGFDFQFEVFTGFNETHCQESLERLVRRSSKFGRVICDN